MHTVDAESVEGLLDTWFRGSLQMIKGPPAKGGFDSQHTQNPKKVCVVASHRIASHRIASRRSPFCPVSM